MDLAKAGAPDCRVTERRNWKRLPLALPVFVRGVAEKGDSPLEFATALNISAGGMLLAARRPLVPEMLITIEIASAPASPLVPPTTIKVVTGRIAWQAEHAAWRLAAIKFTRPLLAP